MTPKVQSIIDQANDDTNYTEFVSTFSYNEALPKVKRNILNLLGDVKPTKEQWASILNDCIDVESTGIYTIENEIYAYTVGEVEIDISELSDEEREELSSEAFIKNNWAYFNRCYDRVVATLNVDKCQALLKEINHD